MQQLRFDAIKKVLCLGAHADDIEIGAGGTVLTLLGARSDVEIHWVVFSACGERRAEASESANRFLDGCHKRRVDLLEFRDGFFPYEGGKIKEQFEELKRAGPPDLILTHQRDDLHQDHRLVSELTWNTYRDHMILEYEIPKYDGGLGSPNVFVEMDDAVFGRKVQSLMEVFETQRSRRWFTPQTFEALARLRGLECNARSGMAEAFYGRKIPLSWK